MEYLKPGKRFILYTTEEGSVRLCLQASETTLANFKRGAYWKDIRTNGKAEE